MTNEVLNQAIYKVLTTQFKKDAKEEHKIVENAGYEIQRYGRKSEHQKSPPHLYIGRIFCD